MKKFGIIMGIIMIMVVIVGQSMIVNEKNNEIKKLNKEVNSVTFVLDQVNQKIKNEEALEARREKEKTYEFVIDSRGIGRLVSE